MRKLDFRALIIIFVLLLAACTEDSAQGQPNVQGSTINVKNESDREITSIELKLYQQDMVQFSPTSMNADESLIVKGETMEYNIRKQDIDFDEPVTIEAVAMIDGVEISAGRSKTFELVQGETYEFELARDPELQFREVQELGTNSQQ